MSETKTATFKVWRGDATGGEFRDYTAEVAEGMVVLDAVHDIQRTQAQDLACRWNCKAGKCGSCSAEVNGMPKLMCMARGGGKGRPKWFGCARLGGAANKKPISQGADESVPDHQGLDHRRVVE